MATIISDDEHAVNALAVRMIIKNTARKMTLYGDNLVPAFEMSFGSKAALDDCYPRLVAAMGA